MSPASYIRYTILPQLEAYSDSGVPRVLGAFNGIAREAEDYSRRMFHSYMAEPADPNLDIGELAEEAQNQGAEYYDTLSSLRQAMINLLAAGFYHLFEQHQAKFENLLRQRGRPVPIYSSLPTWTKVDELRLVANAVKHADGSGARQLRSRRPDLFMHPTVRGTPAELLYSRRERAIEHPLAGTDLFVAPEDLENYREAVRELWVCIEPSV